MKEEPNYFQVNKESWNKKVKVNIQSEMYAIDEFKKGKTSLKQYELNALGDVTGKTMLHLQCHFGQDTLSWSRMGARCLGVDLSDEGIKVAKELAKELELNTDFICCNVLDTSKYVIEVFDILFSSYGVIGWLPDLMPWAQMISERLKPGGQFYLVEFHPIVWMYDYTKNNPELKYHYNCGEAIYEEYIGTYADPTAQIYSKEYGWNHGLGEVVTALTTAGLRIDYLKEHDESPYNVFPNLIKKDSGMFGLKNQLYPLIFEISARKI